MDELLQEEKGDGLSQWELSQNLPPVSQMDREGAQKEMAQINLGGASHPYWKEDDPAHGAVVKRVQGLLQRMVLTPQEQEQATAQQREELDTKVAGYWEQYDREKAKKEYEKIRDKLRESLARDGKTGEIKEADEVFDGALESISQLKKQGVLAKDIDEFLIETLEGDCIENIRRFHWAKTLNEKYWQWAAGKAKKRG